MVLLLWLKNQIIVDTIWNDAHSLLQFSDTSDPGTAAEIANKYDDDDHNDGNNDDYDNDDELTDMTDLREHSTVLHKEYSNRVDLSETLI